MENQKIHSLLKLKDNRTQLRHNLTPAEAALWKALKGKQLNKRKFIRQHSIEHYIADFYCPEERLIVELDGQVHFDPQAMEYDQQRTQRLNELGFTVVRFENKFVFHQLQSVLDHIAAHFQNKDQ